MPEHTSFLTYFAEWLAGNTALGRNLAGLQTVAGHQAIGAHGFEPVLASLLVVLIVVALAAVTRARLAKSDAVVPDDRLSLRTFMEVFVGAFYSTAKDVMGPVRAKRYFPIIGTSACFIFFSNLLGMIPGFLPPTSSWNLTLACAIIVFIAFNFYGIKENGAGYFKHMAGPLWWMAPLIFVIELLSLFVRPITLSVRLMLNMAVDHLLLGIVLGLVMLVVPVPIMILGTLVVVVQTYVFCLLTTIYIGLATEHEDHGDASHGSHGHAHDKEAKHAH